MENQGGEPGPEGLSELHPHLKQGGAETTGDLSPLPHPHPQHRAGVWHFSGRQGRLLTWEQGEKILTGDLGWKRAPGSRSRVERVSRVLGHSRMQRLNHVTYGVQKPELRHPHVPETGNCRETGRIPPHPAVGAGLPVDTADTEADVTA